MLFDNVTKNRKDGISANSFIRMIREKLALKKASNAWGLLRKANYRNIDSIIKKNSHVFLVAYGLHFRTTWLLNSSDVSETIFSHTNILKFLFFGLCVAVGKKWVLNCMLNI